MGLRQLIPDASGPVPPASNNVRVIWADPKPAPSSAPGMSFAPASHVQRALQSKPSAAPDPQRDDPVSGFFRKISEFFSPNKPRPERDLAAEGRRYREQAEQRGRAVGDSKPTLPGAHAGIGTVQKVEADKKAEEQRLAEAAQNEQAARTRARATGAGTLSSMRQMTAEEYNALDGRGRSGDLG